MEMNLKKFEDIFISKVSAICFAVIGLTLGAVAFLKYKQPAVETRVAKLKDTRDPIEIDRQQRLLKATEFINKKLYKRAEDILTKLAREMPRNAFVFSSLSLAQKKMGLLDKAADNLEVAISIEPGQWILYNNLGVLLYERGKAAEALKSFEKALDLAPGTPQILLARAKALETVGKYNDAKQVYSKALEGGKLEGSLTDVIRDRMKKLEFMAYIERGDK